MTEITAVGTPTPILDGKAKVAGSIQFTPDLKLQGMLYAKMVTSMYPHANIRGIDSTDALASPGVVAVLTADDMPDVPPESRITLLLAHGRVIFVGQPIALVLAESELAAVDGAEQVHVDYEPFPAAVTLEQALAPDAPEVWPGRYVDTSTGKSSNVASFNENNRGDVQRGFAESDVIVERTFETQIAHQGALETHGMVAQYDPMTGELTMWASTQAPFGNRTDIAAVLGIDETNIRVIGMPVGGAFGGKNGLYEPLVACAAYRVGRPVRFVLTRSEELLATVPAPALTMKVKIGAKRDGTLVALDVETMADEGCFTTGFAGTPGGLMVDLYRWQHSHRIARNVLTFKPSVGYYRGPTGPSAYFALETLIDELAIKLNIDPVDLREKNMVRTGDPRGQDGDRWPMIGSAEVLKAVREHPVWQGRTQARQQGRGVGVAFAQWGGGSESAAAMCSLHKDGTLQINVGSVDINGTMTSFALIAAEAFGIAPERVKVRFSDTANAPFSGAAAGSKVLYSTGAAVLEAAKEARQQVLQIAADLLEAAVEDIDIIDGKAQVRGAPEHAIPLAEIASQGMSWGSKFAPVIGNGRVGIEAAAPVFSAQLAEVSVDEDTGKVTVHRQVVIQDVGRAINPLAVQGQLMGGATQGLGWALYERMLYDEDGQLITGTLMDYTLPNILDAAQQIDVVLIEVASEHGPMGARGVGEAPVLAAPAAIANAIADTVGVRMTKLPMMAPDVFAAIQQ
ncbi:MAG: xanthine dehydrogenase family protein [Anaerolineae bacterium]|nr:xanthine dehydrogenase family protein [Anaerolineae bacterium]